MNQARFLVFNKIIPPLLRGGLTVTQRITLWYLILSIAPILAIGFLAYQNSRASLEGEIINKLNAVADNKVFILKERIERNLVEAKRLASHPALKDLLSPSFKINFPHL